MQATANPIQVRDRANERRWRQAAAQSIPRQRHLIAPDKPPTGQDHISPYDHRGTIIVACAWLAFYLIMAIHHLISSRS